MIAVESLLAEQTARGARIDELLRACRRAQERHDLAEWDRLTVEVDGLMAEQRAGSRRLADLAVKDSI